VVSAERVRLKERVVFYFEQWNIVGGWKKGGTRFATKSCVWRRPLEYGILDPSKRFAMSKCEFSFLRSLP
jgi:hypothetical protein